MSIKNIFEEAKETYTDVFINELTEQDYKNLIKGREKFVKGDNSVYEKDGYALVEDLPKGKEYYIAQDKHYSYENGCEGGEFTILTTYRNKYYDFTFSWSN